MSLLWKINGDALADLGLELTGGSFRTHGVSTVSLKRASDFDAAELTDLEYGDVAVLTYDAGVGDVTFFSGKVSSVPKYGSGGREGQTLEIEDAWAELERTIYQEAWAIPGDPATVMLPRAIFGVDDAGTRITAGAMIAQVVTAAGLDLAVDVDVTGELPVPSEIVNQTCAEIILQCLRLHPDWIPYIDHSTSPDPTFRVIALSAASETSISVAGAGGVSAFNIVHRQDLLPECVRIVYESSDEVDGEVYRKTYVDEYPTSGVATSGPKVMQAFIPLQGSHTQIQKSRIQTRTIPTDDTHADAKSWLKLHFPQIAGIDDTHFDVTQFDLQLIDDDSEAFPDPVNPEAVRIAVTTVADLPRELVRGSIEDWMRVKVGRISVLAEIMTNGSTTAAEKALMGWLGPIEITATNATTKLYKGRSGWTPGDEVPTGIAQETYEAIHAAMPYQGSVTVAGEDLPTTVFPGKKLNLTGGVTAWATMAAPIHSTQWDVEGGTFTVSFGPPAYLAPQDFIELQRMLRSRPATWMSADERAADTHGSAGSASAAGDTVAGFDQPGGTAGPAGKRDLNLTINHWIETTLGGLDTNGSDTMLIWRKGDFVGTTDPGDTPANLVEVTLSEVLPSS
jgi:hypothetical protein